MAGSQHARSFFCWWSFKLFLTVILTTMLQVTLMQMSPTAQVSFSRIHTWEWNYYIHKAYVLSALLAVSKLSLHDCIHETHRQCRMVPLAAAFLPIFDKIRLAKFCQSDGSEMFLTVILISICLLIKKVEHFLMYLLVIQTSFLEKLLVIAFASFLL